MAIALSGDLQKIGLASILQLVDAEAFTGRLELQPTGEICTRDGQPVSAQLGSLRGRAALEQLFIAQPSAFVLHDDEPPAGNPIGSMTPVVLSGLRLSDEWSRLSALVLAPAPNAPPPQGVLKELVPLMDGHCTLAEAVAFSGMPASAVIDAVLGALEQRHLRHAAPPDPARARTAAAPPKPEDYFDLIDLGREHLRAGRLTEAEAAFRRALMARPGDRTAEQNMRRVSQLRQSRT